MNLEDEAQEDEGRTFVPFPEEARPRVDHLIIEDEEPMENIFFEKQERLLTEPLYCSWEGPGEGAPFAVFANVGLFPEPRQSPLVPDVMLSTEVRVADDLSRKENRSYFVWEFGKPPDVAIEFVSDRRGGEATDKMRAYARIRVLYYVIFDPDDRLKGGVLRAFRLAGKKYEPTDPAWLPDAGLGLRLWEGEYEGHRDRWLRWCDREAKVIATGRERAEQARTQAERERQRAERLAAKLRELGVDPSSLEGA
jgi:Uma2 family endonuclease